MEGFFRGTGFDWDEGNVRKNWFRHGVSREECEQVFANDPFRVYEDRKHSAIERRYYVLGRTDSGRRLAVICTHRGGLIRVISARDMNRRERLEHERTRQEAPETDPQVQV